MKMSISQIEQLTGLTGTQIEELQRQLKQSKIFCVYAGGEAVCVYWLCFLCSPIGLTRQTRKFVPIVKWILYLYFAAAPVRAAATKLWE
jgi:hypothetical protein